MTTTAYAPMVAGLNLMKRVAGYLFIGTALMWGWLLFRWQTFSTFSWDPLNVELFMANWPGLLPNLFLIALLVLDLVIAYLLLRQHQMGTALGLGRAILGILAAAGYFYLNRDFYGACLLLAVSGMMIALLRENIAWSLNYPAAFWLIVFFVAPMLIVFVVSLGERTRLGTVSYPAFSLDPRVYFDDYIRFFQPINGDYIYLRIFWRSLMLASGNTLICLLIGYPFAYWIARRPPQYRGLLIFLVMIPFWTNFLVRTYAWMLILRDSGLINTFWATSLHGFAEARALGSPFFTWLSGITQNKLPLLFNQGAVFLGLFYGYLPFVVLPIYSNLEKLDWSLLEAADDLGANTWRRTMRILLPLTMPGTVAAAIIVFIPSLGAYVTPDLLGGGKVALMGNVLQQQFMTVRDWPFGAAIGFIMMTMMLIAILIYFQVDKEEEGN